MNFWLKSSCAVFLAIGIWGALLQADNEAEIVLEKISEKFSTDSLLISVLNNDAAACHAHIRDVANDRYDVLFIQDSSLRIDVYTILGIALMRGFFAQTDHERIENKLIIEELLEHGADPNGCDMSSFLNDKGLQVLTRDSTFYATAIGNFDALQLLLKHGAAVHIYYSDGKHSSLLDFFKTFERGTEWVALVEEHMRKHPQKILSGDEATAHSERMIRLSYGMTYDELEAFFKREQARLDDRGQEDQSLSQITPGQQIIYEIKTWFVVGAALGIAFIVEKFRH